MRRILTVLITVLALLNSVFGQDSKQENIRILFQGRVIDSKSLSSLPGSQLFVNRAFSAISDEKGSFALYVSVNDTLVFTRTGYKPATFIINDTLVGKQYIAGIFMSSDTLEIEEVIIVPRIANLRTELLNSRRETKPEIENARYNVAVSAYQGRVSTGELGDPESNYDVIRQRHKINAYERGGIPSDRIVGLSPFMLIPAAYLLIHGLPEKPAPLKPDITDRELNDLIDKYLKKR